MWRAELKKITVVVGTGEGVLISLVVVLLDIEVVAATSLKN